MSTVVESLASLSLGAPEEALLKKGTKEWELHLPTEEIDAKDEGTPDKWIPRNPELLRNTGRHPLNCEPPMPKLMDSGFITPVSLHFVRNHGAVPKLNWNTHRIDITGLVDRPMSFTMDELLLLPNVTIPVTLSCSGNRRKEQNLTKKSIGFNWGPTAISTTYWTGVRLCDVLKLARAKGVTEGAKYVCYRGPKEEVPKGEDGSYGTCIPLEHAMNPANDVLIAFKQNGRWLTPDHGYPVRMVVPGFIAGRMVKWLSEITVSNTESANFYHLHDNRVLPPHVDEQVAKEQGWFYKPEFAVYELNVNSAVSRPWHDETLSLAQNKPYTVKGYAVTGGGRRVIRVEVSVDAGKSWKQANINRLDSNNIYGKTWTWVHWNLELQVFDFINTDEMLVRAVDSAQNTQPEKLTWNVMGQMNNCYFKVHVHKELSKAGEFQLRFQHPAPTEVGALGNVGWRDTSASAPASTPAPALPAPASQPAAPSTPSRQAPSTSSGKVLTMAEVAKNNTEKSCWFVHEGKVYDATTYLDDHPGGAESILLAAGTDATLEFNAIHSANAKALLKNYYIGDLGSEQAAAKRPAAKPAVAPAPVVPASALDPKKKIPFALSEKIELTHNTRLFRFALQSPTQELGLPVGQHMFIYANINGTPCMRAYTPTSSDDDVGHFDLVVKVYKANENPRFPEGGKMSQYLDSLNIGDTIDVKGPVGHFTYVGNGDYIRNRRPGYAKQLCMIAGGTGITPLYQVIKSVLKDPSDRTQIKLLYANHTEEDILLREELEELACRHANFDIWYTVSEPSDRWGYSSGYINKDMLDCSLFPPSEDGLVMMCGPKPMIENACKPNLEQLGWEKCQMIEF